MTISQKCQYAVRAILELSKHYDGQVPLKSGDIAERQAIPARFLEVILNELKTLGVLEARRGVQGGFILTTNPQELTVGRIIRLIDGPFDPVRCTGEAAKVDCPLQSRCSLLELWSEAKTAVESVYDNWTFQKLVERDREISRRTVSDYCI